MFGISLDDESRASIDALEGAVLAGLHGKWIPLSGGSDTRADVRNWYRDRALAYRVEFRATGHDVRIGGPCYRGRGMRFVAYGERHLTWRHWRKAKRDSRKCLAREVKP